MPQSNAPLEDAILGIDIGSTSARLFLLTETGREIVVESDQFGDHTRFEPGDFSVTCYPFQKSSVGGPYIGNAIDKDREGMSLKPVFLLLSDADPADLKNIVLEYPHGELVMALMEGRGRQDKQFRVNLKKALSDFVKVLGTRLIEACQKERLRVTQVGFALPAHWPCAVEPTIWDSLLRKLLKAGSNIQFSRDTVFFHTETQALAHHLLRHCSRKSLKVPSAHWRDFLLADFGGHNLNISMYHAEYASHGVKAFYEIDESTGVVGGGEMVDYYIGEQCEKTVMSQGRTLSRRQKQALINDFHRRKREPDFDDANEEHVMTLHGGGINVPLTAIEVSEAFENAMYGPWSKFTSVLQSQAQLNNTYTPQVIVSGGTSRSQAVKDGVTMLCRSCEYEDPIFVDELTMHIGARYPSLSVAKGAAYATANSMTVQEFINRGAAIGVQTKQSGEVAWDNRAHVLCRNGVVIAQTVDLEEGDELKLICDPFWNPCIKSRTLSYTRSYDVFHLGTFRAGAAKITAGFAPVGGDDEWDMRLDLCVMWHAELNREPRQNDWFAGTMELPLRFDRSSSCVLVDENRITGEIPADALVSGCGASMDEEVNGRDMASDTTEAQSEAPGLGFFTSILGDILGRAGRGHADRQTRNADRRRESSEVDWERRPERPAGWDKADDYSAYGSADDSMDLDYTPQH